MYGFFENQLGDKSMMRLLAFIGCIYAGYCILIGSIALILGYSDGVVAMATGMGLYTSGALAKYFQKRLEEKTEQVTKETECVEKP